METTQSICGTCLVLIKRAYFLAFLAMMAIAGNSLLCRLALKHAVMDVASFTTARIMASALMLISIRLPRLGRYCCLAP